MSESIKSIWSKVSEGRTVEVLYDGEDCRVTINGKEVAKGWPQLLNPASRRNLKAPLEATHHIGTVMFRGLAQLRAAKAEWAAYDRALKAAIERDGFAPATKPESDLDALIASHPAAWLYLRIESKLEVSNWAECREACYEAKEILLAGGSAGDAAAIAEPYLS